MDTVIFYLSEMTALAAAIAAMYIVAVVAAFAVVFAFLSLVLLVRSLIDRGPAPRHWSGKGWW